MDNKKTFADLFKDVDNNTEETNNKINNSNENELETKEVESEDSINFSNGITDIFKMASNEINENTSKKIPKEEPKEINKKLFGLEDNNIITKENTNDENKESTKEESKEINKESTTNIFGLEDNNIITKENTIDENKESTKEESKEINKEPTTNIFGLEDNNIVEDNKIQNTNDDELNDEVKIVELTDNTSLDEKTYNDIFKKEESIEESKEIIEEKNIEINNSNEEFVVNNPLFNDMISLDESNKIKKNIDKLNLANTKHFEVKVVQKKEPLIKFIIGVISYAFFIWLLLIGITLLVYVLDIKVRASKGDYSAPVFNAYVVLTGSMLPEIQVNDVVITKRIEAKELKVGDIITFASTDSRFAGTIITHRIIKKNPAMDGGEITFQTKGDNNNVADSALVPASNVYGKVILKIPKLGWLQEFLATDGGWIIVILIPCLTVISYDIVKIFKGLKRKKYNNIKVKK